ncbi:hypothetical protein [Sphingomonas endolithica]|uniref:hypothetical protein n=1 Tax=Sphingomonas endolithica TaxID=2972485 RepID=UPI0021B00BD8|nr:hypothetical protein [Sphingomonas sp. ZFBP2030]
MPINKIWCMPLTLAALACAPAAADQPPARSKVVDEISRCRSVLEVTARAACYDLAVPALTERITNGTIVLLEKGEIQRTRRSLFGFALPHLSFLDGGREDKPETVAIKELSTTIVSVRASGYGMWSMTLAEGGTWRTTEPSRTLIPRSGDPILIKRGIVGGYMATIGGVRQIRLQRIG